LVVCALPPVGVNFTRTVTLVARRGSARLGLSVRRTDPALFTVRRVRAILARRTVALTSALPADGTDKRTVRRPRRSAVTAAIERAVEEGVPLAPAASTVSHWSSVPHQ
jgi:hypothetical protein